jgi:hypothetical protein
MFADPVRMSTGVIEKIFILPDNLNGKLNETL